MKVTLRISFVICVCSALTLTGCQSGFLKKPDFSRLTPDFTSVKPNFEKLAFWKNDNLKLSANKDDVDRPASLFSPDGAKGSSTKEQVQASIDSIAAEVKRNKNKQTASTEPIRQPYSLDSINPKIGDRIAKSNDFVSQTIENAKTKTNQAFQSTQDLAAKTGEFAEQTANTVAGWQSGLKNSASNAVKSAADKTKVTVNQFVNAGEKAVNRTVSAASEALDNSFVAPNGSQASKQRTGGVLTPLISSANSNDFASQYKAAANSFDRQSGTSPIQQSSFNAGLQKDSGNASQPVQSISATQYPSTSFAKFQPLTGQKKAPAATLKIPAHLSSGESSFAPGSTKPLDSDQ